MDEGIAIDLSKVPDKVKCIVLLVKVSNVEKFKVETELNRIKHASYGVEFWGHKVTIHTKNIGQTVKWEEIAKGLEGEEVPVQHAVIVSYVIRRRFIPELWTLEDVSYQAQPYKNQEELTTFLEEISKFYYRSNDALKEEEEEEKNERPSDSSQ